MRSYANDLPMATIMRRRARHNQIRNHIAGRDIGEHPTCAHGLRKSEGCPPCDALEAELAEDLAFEEAAAGRGVTDCAAVEGLF